MPSQPCTGKACPHATHHIGLPPPPLDALASMFMPSHEDDVEAYRSCGVGKSGVAGRATSTYWGRGGKQGRCHAQSLWNVWMDGWCLEAVAQQRRSATSVCGRAGGRATHLRLGVGPRGTPRRPARAEGLDLEVDNRKANSIMPEWRQEQALLTSLFHPCSYLCELMKHHAGFSPCLR
jgi:hypothetical protein